jgi:hypothetical protein
MEKTKIKKIKVEAGYLYKFGQATQAWGNFTQLWDLIYDVSGGIYTEIKIEEHLPRTVKTSGVFERRKDMYRFEMPAKDFKKLTKLIPKDNEYDIYVKKY